MAEHPDGVPQTGLPLGRCFFTNFYMGLRETGPETGRFPGARDGEFVQRCARFFERQMEAIEPKLIVTLGMPALSAVARVFGCQFQGRYPNALMSSTGLSLSSP